MLYNGIFLEMESAGRIPQRQKQRNALNVLNTFLLCACLGVLIYRLDELMKFSHFIKDQAAAKAWETGHVRGTREGEKEGPMKRALDAFPPAAITRKCIEYMESLMLSCLDLPRPDMKF